MVILLSITGVALLASLLASRRKTLAGVMRGLKMLWAIVPMLLGIIAGVSILLAAVPPASLARVIGGDGVLSFMIALFVGSLALIPGVVAFPLAALLRDQGASTAVLAAFITTLMMVGIFTLPLEIRYLGRRVALLRNALAFVGSVIVAVVMAVILR
jgi:uncharacterized membrane protein YraQ (UPF0718 family)